MLIRDILTNKEELVEGEFRVFGGPRQWFISDTTGDIPFEAANMDTGVSSYSPSIDDVVKACLIIDYTDDGIEVVGRVEPLDLPTAPLRTLAYPAVKRPELALELDSYISEMRYEPLKQFINDLLNQEEVALGLVCARGSQDHHHSEHGGLLRHIVEMARAALYQDFVLAPSEYERELLLVSVLVHDIGKANAGFLSRQKKSTRKKGHKALGKELVESPMQELELTSPEMAQDLRVVLKDVLGTSRVSATKVGRLLHGLDHDFSFKDASSESLKGTAPNAKWGHLKGKPGTGRSYYRVRHLTVIK